MSIVQLQVVYFDLSDALTGIHLHACHSSHYNHLTYKLVCTRIVPYKYPYAYLTSKSPNINHFSTHAVRGFFWYAFLS
jgi:hypothetical protein